MMVFGTISCASSLTIVPYELGWCASMGLPHEAAAPEPRAAGRAMPYVAPRGPVRSRPGAHRRPTACSSSRQAATCPVTPPAVGKRPRNRWGPDARPRVHGFAARRDQRGPLAGAFTRILVPPGDSRSPSKGRTDTKSQCLARRTTRKQSCRHSSTLGPGGSGRLVVARRAVVVPKRIGLR
jgi:hypothetical protein